MSTAAGVPCPLCPAGPYTEPGRLAGHLVEVHGQSAAVALRDARRLLAPSAAALGKPVHTIVSDLTPPDPKEVPVAKKKKRAQRKCRICTKPGHDARQCIENTVVDALERPDGAGVDLVAKAQANARALVKSKIDDELVMARAYLAELERLANA